jgi:hydrogenase large subunit
MKITKEFLQRVEGEATLELQWEDDAISYAKIKFLTFRGIEKILEKRPFLDALAITPRVCGICNTSHTIAAINAIEDAYKSVGIKVDLTQKAKYIREFALNCEKIQNHIKWLYFTILPQIFDLSKEKSENIRAFEGSEWIKAQKASNTILKAMAIFTGQWPHGSFCMPGGVTCDPIDGDKYEAMRYLDEVYSFCEEEIFGTTIDEFLSYDSSMQIMTNNGKLKYIVEKMMENNLQCIGKSYDQFISLGENTNQIDAKKSIATRVLNVNLNLISESLENTFFIENGYTYSKSAMYKKSYYESGPIARMMIGKDKLIKDFHRKFKDSSLTRIASRVAEIAHLLKRSNYILNHINLLEASCNTPLVNLNHINAKGIGRCEAARGSLLHEVVIKKGLISSYDIITPTVWNLGNGSRKEPAIAQKAIIGLDSPSMADFVFKTFDVCAVCTTQ